MADVLSLAVLGLVLIGASTVASALYCALIALARWLARAWRSRRQAPDAAVQAAPPSAVAVLRLWLPCHRPRCGHLQTVHHMTVTGLARCSGCGAEQPLP